MIEHHIQREVLQRLMGAKSLRFSELKPDGMESNIFMYHVKQLIKDGYVVKRDEGYMLAAKGLSYVDGLSSENRKPRPQPKLIAILALRDGAGRWLLAERKMQPYIGQLMFPSGKQHLGESTRDHALRELKEKTGLTNMPLHYRGYADICIVDDNEAVLTHAVAQIYEATMDTELTAPETERFRFVWYDFSADTDRLMPGTLEIHRALQEPEPLRLEIRAVQG